MNGALPGVTELIFDFETLDYISSAGLRVVLKVVKILSDGGKVVVRNTNEIVKEVFEVTFFSDLVTIE